MATINVNISKIKYDTDGDNKLAATLPKHFENVEIDVEDPTDKIEIEDTIADWISDTTGFCVFGFDYKY